MSTALCCSTGPPACGHKLPRPLRFRFLWWMGCTRTRLVLGSCLSIHLSPLSCGAFGSGLPCRGSRSRRSGAPRVTAPSTSRSTPTGERRGGSFGDIILSQYRSAGSGSIAALAFLLECSRDAHLFIVGGLEERCRFSIPLAQEETEPSSRTKQPSLAGRTHRHRLVECCYGCRRRRCRCLMSIEAVATHSRRQS